MNTRQKELFERLRDALDTISKSPETADEVALLFEDFVITFEEIAGDLETTSDKETAATLKEIVNAAATIGNIPLSAEQIAATT